MLTLSDFWSGTVFLQAALTAGATVMTWRGLHLSGDKKFIFWGSASVLAFLVTLFMGAMANHDSTAAIDKANNRAADSDRKLTDIQTGIIDLKQIVSPNGGSAAEVVASAVAKIQEQQMAIDSLQRRMNEMKRAGRLDTHFYQDGKDAASVGSFEVDQASGEIHL